MYPASFKQLQALMLVARHQSVSRAAEAMHVTQPAVSLHLKLLEEAAKKPQKYKWPGAKLRDGSIADY